MSVGDWIYLAGAGTTAILLVIAAVSDIVRYRIPNYLVYAIAIAFAVATTFHFSWVALGWSALAAIGMFLLGAGFFALGLFGGGDVKLIAAVALWTGIADLPRFVLVMSAVGGVLGLIWIIRRRRYQRRLATEGTASGDSAAPVPPRKFKLPYGVAIAFAGLDFFAISAHSPFAPFVPWIL